MIALLAIAAAAAATATATPSAKPAPRGDDTRQVCHTIKYLGSRLNSARICKTKAEWNEVQAEHDRLVREQQTKDRAFNSG